MTVVASSGDSPRRVDDESHEQTRNQTRARKSDNPAGVDPENHTPVDSAPVTRAQADTNGSTRNALSSGHGEFYEC